jgi:hypothetical protein
VQSANLLQVIENKRLFLVDACPISAFADFRQSDGEFQNEIPKKFLISKGLVGGERGLQQLEKGSVFNLLVKYAGFPSSVRPT